MNTWKYYLLLHKLTESACQWLNETGHCDSLVDTYVTFIPNLTNITASNVLNDDRIRKYIVRINIRILPTVF